MPDGPTREYERLTALELNGCPVEIASAELAWVQYWRGEEPAQRDWELVGRTFEPGLRDGAQPVVITLGTRRLSGRIVLTVSASGGYAVFKGVGLGDLVEVREVPGS